MKNPCVNKIAEKLYEKRIQTGDIDFIVGGEVIRAHRCILAAVSARYEAKFYGSKPEKDSITITNVLPAAIICCFCDFANQPRLLYRHFFFSSLTPTTVFTSWQQRQC